MLCHVYCSLDHHFIVHTLGKNKRAKGRKGNRSIAWIGSSMMHHPLHIVTCHPHYVLPSLHIHTSLQTFLFPIYYLHPSAQHSLHPLHATAILYHSYVLSLHMVHDTLVCPTCHPTLCIIIFLHHIYRIGT